MNTIDFCLIQDGRHPDLKMMFGLRCEHDTWSTISLTDSNFGILCYFTKKTNGIDTGLIS